MSLKNRIEGDMATLTEKLRIVNEHRDKMVKDRGHLIEQINEHIKTIEFYEGRCRYLQSVVNSQKSELLKLRKVSNGTA